MNDSEDSSRGDVLSPNVNDQIISDRVHQLSWALIDGQINDDEFALLDTLLLSDDKARSSYLGCVQLHADLMSHFAVPTGKSGVKPGTQVLGLLSGESPVGFQSPSKEATS